MIAVKNVRKIFACIVKKQVIFFNTFPLKGRRIGPFIIMGIYIYVYKAGYNSYKEKSNNQALPDISFFKKSQPGNQPAKENEVNKK
jgi:hypothetical protein